MTLSDLMPNSFIAKYSQYKSVSELFNESNFILKTQEDFSAVPKHEMDDFITKNTTFSSWSEMQQQALDIYRENKTEMFSHITKINAGNYFVSDGRYIEKKGRNWYVLDHEKNEIFGPVATLKSAKEYVNTGDISISTKYSPTKYGRRKSKRDYISSLAAERENGNSGAAIIYVLIVFFICIIFLALRGY